MAVIQQRICSSGVVKLSLGFIALSIAAYIVGPPLYWHFLGGSAPTSLSSSSSLSFSSTSTNCPPCSCNCNSSPLITIPDDCSKHDPGVSEDTEKNFAELLAEELKLRETEAAENQKRADMALLEAKKITSQYQKEADKCNSGMETCEEAREKAEAALVSQKKLTAVWEQRARQKGWKDGVARTAAHLPENVQSV
ncbi:Tuftelin [Bienertia sinuspersici]